MTSDAEAGRAHLADSEAAAPAAGVPSRPPTVRASVRPLPGPPAGPAAPDRSRFVAVAAVRPSRVLDAASMRAYLAATRDRAPVPRASPADRADYDPPSWTEYEPPPDPPNFAPPDPVADTLVHPGLGPGPAAVPGRPDDEPSREVRGIGGSRVRIIARASVPMLAPPRPTSDESPDGVAERVAVADIRWMVVKASVQVPVPPAPPDPTPEPHPGGPMTGPPPAGSGAEPRPSGSGAEPRIAKPGTGPRPAGFEAGPRDAEPGPGPRPAVFEAKPRLAEPGARPRPADSGTELRPAEPRAEPRSAGSWPVGTRPALADVVQAVRAAIVAAPEAEAAASDQRPALRVAGGRGDAAGAGESSDSSGDHGADGETPDGSGGVAVAADPPVRKRGFVRRSWLPLAVALTSAFVAATVYLWATDPPALDGIGRWGGVGAAPAVQPAAPADVPTPLPSGVSQAWANAPTNPNPFGSAAPVAQGTPTEVKIPAIGVDTTLETLHLGKSGELTPPRDFAKAGWYADGTVPGDNGPAVIAGHVDSRRGPAVFYRLREMVAGDRIDVVRGGKTIHFTVVSSGWYAKTNFPTDKVYGPTPDRQLRVITCGGVFDHTLRSYKENLVIYAVAG